MGYTVIFGGTFNPFHMGHFDMLKALNEDLRVEKIFVVPDKIPPHKKCEFLAQEKDRVNMCRLAVKNFSKAEVCLIELEREGKSYSYDTVISLKALYPEKQLAFACGGDMITSLNTWNKWESLIREVTFIAFRRGDSDNEEFIKSIHFLKASGANIIVFENDITDISSTEIRENIKSNGAKGLVPEDIYKYITETGVYNGQ